MKPSCADPSGEILDTDWEYLAKRLLAAMQIGIRIEQDSGHRYIFEEQDADNCCDLAESIRCKQYGSYSSCLDVIDEELARRGEKTLLDKFDDLDSYDSLGFVFGKGTQ